jgi:flagellar motor switch/type III secretory pathway protein FliN
VNPHPFPWGSLDSLTRTEASVLRAVRRWGAGHVRLSAVETTLGALTGVSVGVRVRRLQLLSGARPFGEGYGVLLGAHGADARTGEALLQVESALAATLVARAIERAPAFLHRVGAESPAIAGGFAALVAVAARRACASVPLRVLSAGPAVELQAQLGSPADFVAMALTVTVADDAYAATLILCTRLALSAPEPPWTRDGLRALGTTPLAVPVVATAFQATVSDVASLRSGDALIPPQWPLARVGDGSRDWAGRLMIAPPTGALGVTCDLSDKGQLVLGGQARALWVREAEMVEPDESSDLVSAMGDVPVLVRVEIGEACMAAREWAALERGDVIALGRRIGERVVLRVGGVPVASGELVEIEGTVGVRIVERLSLARTVP